MAKDQETKDEGASQGNHWRENIEAITMAIVMAVMLKYFIVEAYKIPTGSMQPTLMGNDETDIKDRILVDKLSYHFREPERFEVTVFKYPLDLSKNFVKRMVGVGPEQLKIMNGDLWNRPDANSPWKVLRRPRPIQTETWKALNPGEAGLEGWRATESARTWKVEGQEISARGTGSLRYPKSKSIDDNYRDGYPLSIRAKIRNNRHSGERPVGDLRVSGEIEMLPGCERFMIDMREGNRQYHFIFPGPAAEAGATLRIEAEDTVKSFNTAMPETLTVDLGSAWSAKAGDSFEFGVQNLDDLLSLEIDGEILLELEVPTATNQTSAILMHLEGEGADLSDVMMYRDIFYRDDIARRPAEWVIPDDHYVMLGDNTQDSSDSREWQLACIQYPKDTGPIIRGNFRPNGENPREVTGGPGGPEQWFRDEFGELHHWKLAQASLPTFVQVEFVPRELITGRAVAVFWPIKPSFKLWRLGWIH
jgi:signal peptidase I